MIGELLTIGLELNASAWTRGMRTAAAEAETFAAQMERRNIRLQHSIETSARQYDNLAERVQRARLQIERTDALARAAALEGQAQTVEKSKQKGAAHIASQYRAMRDVEVQAAQQAADEILQIDRTMHARRIAQTHAATQQRTALEHNATRLMIAQHEQQQARQEARENRDRATNLVYLQRAGKRFAEAMSADIDAIRGAIGSANNIVVGIGTGLQTAADLGVRAFGTLTKAAQGFARTMFESLGNLPLFGIEKGFSALSPLASAFLGIGDVIAQAVGSVVQAGSAVTQAVATTFASVGQAAATVFGQAFSSTIQTIINVASLAPFAAAITALAGPVGLAISGVLIAAMTAFEGLTRGLGGVFDAINGIVNGIVGAVKSLGEGLITFVESAVTSIENLAQAGLSIVMQLGQLMSTTAMNFVEEANKFNVSFRHLGDQVASRLFEFADAVGRSQLSMISFAGQLESMFYTLGFTREEAAKFSEAITKLSVDLGSFFNVADAKALHALESGIVGNHRALRQFGIGINVSTLLMELHRDGTSKSIQEYSEYEKAVARLNIILRQTTDIQGDAERTIGTFANRIKQVTGLVEDLATRYGVALNQALMGIADRTNLVENVKTVLQAIMPVAAHIVTQMAELAATAAQAAAAWTQTGGGAAAFLVAARIGFEEVLLYAKRFSVAILSIGITLYAVARQMPAMFDVMKQGFIGVARTMESVFYRVQVGYFAALSTMQTALAATASMMGFTGLVTWLGVDAALNVGRMMDAANMAATASLEAGRAFDAAAAGAAALNFELANIGVFVAESMRVVTGEVNVMLPVFTDAGSDIQTVYEGVAGTFYALTRSIYASELAIARMRDTAVDTANEIRNAYQNPNLFQQVNLPTPGPDNSYDWVVPYAPREYAPVPTYGSGSARGSWSGGGYNYSGGGSNWSDPGFASGGYVRGASGVDQIRARLTSGEFVMNPRATRENRGELEEMNAGRRGRGSVSFSLHFPAVTRLDTDAVEQHILPAIERAQRRRK